MCLFKKLSKSGSRVLVSNWYMLKSGTRFCFFVIKEDFIGALQVDLKSADHKVVISLRNKTTNQEVFYQKSCQTNVYVIDNLTPGKYTLKIKYALDSGHTIVKLNTTKKKNDFLGEY